MPRYLLTTDVDQPTPTPTIREIPPAVEGVVTEIYVAATRFTLVFL